MKAIKNLIIQYGTCNQNCSYCYLKKLDIKKNYNKFWKTIKYLKNYKIDNLFISFQDAEYRNDYNNIIKLLFYKKLFIQYNYNNIVSNYMPYAIKDAIISYSVDYYIIVLKNLSFYLNNSRFDKLEKILEKKNSLYFAFVKDNPIYLSIEKYEKINLIKLFELYTKYPNLIELDSCYKRIINEKTCKDVYVLNEDGNLYTCPYTLKFKDNDIKNKEKKCPYINL